MADAAGMKSDCEVDLLIAGAGSYPGPGTTLGPGIVFAYRAAMHARGTPATF